MVGLGFESLISKSRLATETINVLDLALGHYPSLSPSPLKWLAFPSIH